MCQLFIIKSENIFFWEWLYINLSLARQFTLIPCVFHRERDVCRMNVRFFLSLRTIASPCRHSSRISIKASPRDFFSRGTSPSRQLYFCLFEDTFDWRMLAPQASSTVRVCTFRRSHCTAHLLRKKPRIPSKDTSLYSVRSLISRCWKTHKTMSMP